MTEIYKLRKDEIMQALADYLTKKYGMTEKRTATLDLKIEGRHDTNKLLVTVTVNFDKEETI